METLNFLGGNPGAVYHGNFINYYQFHPPEHRINVLPKDIWTKNESMIVFDIGCNVGDLTLSLYNFIIENVTKSCYILAIDIDPILIDRAKEKNTNQNIVFQNVDFMDSQSRNTVINNFLKSVGATQFSATFCFSLTMWIHLNNGDVGLLIFLREICKFSSMVIIEPQPWKCYKTAVKRLKINGNEFPKYKTLKLRNNVEKEIENILLEEEGVTKITETHNIIWGRKLLFFKIAK